MLEGMDSPKLIFSLLHIVRSGKDCFERLWFCFFFKAEVRNHFGDYTTLFPDTTAPALASGGGVSHSPLAYIKLHCFLVVGIIL